MTAAHGDTDPTGYEALADALTARSRGRSYRDDRGRTVGPRRLAFLVLGDLERDGWRLVREGRR